MGTSHGPFRWEKKVAADLSGLDEFLRTPPPPAPPPAPAAPRLAELHTRIAGNTTTFRSWAPKQGYQEIQIPTRVGVDRHYAAEHPGAGDPFETGNLVGVTNRNAGKAWYGPAGAFIDVGDPRSRDIHGGGKRLPDPMAADQGWWPTNGCTRAQNADVIRLGQAITKFQKANPGIPIRYRRTKE